MKLYIPGPWRPDPRDVPPDSPQSIRFFKVATILFFSPLVLMALAVAVVVIMAATGQRFR